MAPKHVCFDKDGTLTDVHTYWTHVCGLRADALSARFGLPASDRTKLLDWMGVVDGRIKPGGPVGHKPRVAIVAAVAEKLGRDAAAVTEVFAEVDRAQQSADDFRVLALPGAYEALESLKARGAKLSIYSSDRTENVKRAMKIANLAAFFDTIVGGDAVKKPKPHPEGFETACRLVGVPPSESVYVGDTVEDLHMAASVGAEPVGVPSGVCGEAELRASGKRVIKTLAELA